MKKINLEKENKQKYQSSFILKIIILFLIIILPFILLENRKSHRINTHAASGQACQGIFIPADYSNSGPEMNKTLAAGNAVAVIRVNNGNGPGSNADPALIADIAKARANGTRVLGYVDTSFGARDPNAVKADIDKWKQLFNVTDIMFDNAYEQNTSKVSYYQSLTAYVHRTPGAIDKMNAGDIIPEAYLQAADIIGIFEGPYSKFVNFQVPGWVHNYSSSRFSGEVHSVPSVSNIANGMSLFNQNNIGYIMLTDSTRPWVGFSTDAFWNAFVATVKSNCTNTGGPTGTISQPPTPTAAGVTPTPTPPISSPTPTVPSGSSPTPTTSIPTDTPSLTGTAGTPTPTDTPTNTPTPTPTINLTPAPTPLPVTLTPGTAYVRISFNSLDSNDALSHRTTHPRLLTLYFYTDESYLTDPDGTKAVHGGITDTIFFTPNTPNSSIYGIYTNSQFRLPQFPSGSYYVFARSEGTFREPLGQTPVKISVDPIQGVYLDFTQNNTYQFPVGKVASTNKTTLTIEDYNDLLTCYNYPNDPSKVNQCRSLNLFDKYFVNSPFTDFNLDNSIDGIDFNLFLSNFLKNNSGY